MSTKVMRCTVCGFVYRAKDGCSEGGLTLGAHWEDLADDWQCPECGARKADFHQVEDDEASLDY